MKDLPTKALMSLGLDAPLLSRAPASLTSTSSRFHAMKRFQRKRTERACGACLIAGLLLAFPGMVAHSLTLADLVKTAPNPAGSRPKDGPFYAALFLSFEGSTPVTPETCVDSAVLTFIRTAFGDSRAASASLGIDVAPILNDHPQLHLLLFSSTINEKPTSGSPKCFTGILGNGTQLTAFMPSSGNDGFNLSLEFETRRTLDSHLIKNVTDKAVQLSSLLGGSTALAVATTAARASIQNSAAQLDADRSTLLGAFLQIPVKESFYFFPAHPSVSADAWQLSVASPKDVRSGMRFSSWVPVATIYFVYKQSVIRDGNTTWPDIWGLLGRDMFPSSLNSLNSVGMMLQANQIAGLNLKALGSAKTAEDMFGQCSAVRAWLNRFLVGDDALAMRYAVMKYYSGYDTYPAARTEDCFSSNDLTRLAMLRSDYTFKSAQSKVKDGPTLLKQRFDALNEALDKSVADDSAIVSLLTSPTSSFRLSIRGESSFFGADAIGQFRSNTTSITCWHARKGDGDLDLIGGILNQAGNKTPALFYFSEAGKLNQVETVSADTVRSALGLSVQEWPDKSRQSCALSQTSLLEPVQRVGHQEGAS